MVILLNRWASVQVSRGLNRRLRAAVRQTDGQAGGGAGGGVDGGAESRAGGDVDRWTVGKQTSEQEDGRADGQAAELPGSVR